MIDGARVRSKTYTVDSLDNSHTQDLQQAEQPQQDPTKPLAVKQRPPTPPPVVAPPDPPKRGGVVPTPSTAKLIKKRRRSNSR